MVTGLSMQNKDSSGDGRETSKVSRAGSQSETKVKARACCFVSRHSVSVGQNSSSNPTSPGSTRCCQEWNREERSLYSGSYSVQRAAGNRELGMVQKVLAVSQKRKPRETVNMCKRSFIPSNENSRCKGSSG